MDKSPEEQKVDKEIGQLQNRQKDRRKGKGISDYSCKEGESL